MIDLDYLKAAIARGADDDQPFIEKAWTWIDKAAREPETAEQDLPDVLFNLLHSHFPDRPESDLWRLVAKIIVEFATWNGLAVD